MAFALTDAHERHGLWIEDSWLDRLDKRLSLPVFTLELPLVAEYLLTTVGTWFGLPAFALVLGPCFAAAVYDSNLGLLPVRLFGGALVVPQAAACFAAVLASLSFLWFGLALLSIRSAARGESGMSGFVYAYMPLLNKRSMIIAFAAAPHVGLLLTKAFASPQAHTASVYLVMAWLLSCSLNELLKSIMKRRRPVVVEHDLAAMARDPAASPVSPASRIKTPFKDALLATNRHFPELQHMMRTPVSQHSSCPSGDATGAAAIVVAVISIAHGVTYGAGSLEKVPATSLAVGALACLSSCFGRMFFHAHHLLDVALGLCGGVASSVALTHYGGNGTTSGAWYSWGFLAGAQVVLTVLVMLRSPALFKKDANAKKEY